MVEKRMGNKNKTWNAPTGMAVDNEGCSCSQSIGKSFTTDIGKAVQSCYVANTSMIMAFLSPCVLMHSGLLCIAFCVCLSVYS